MTDTIAPSLASNQPERLSGIDATRFLALIGIVVIHAGAFIPEFANRTASTDLDLVSRFGVPFFFAASGYFLSRASSDFWDAAGRSLQRILIPFIFWTLVYVLIAHPSLQEVFQKQYLKQLVLGSGPAFHLWFLPSLAVCTILLLACRNWHWITLVTLAFTLYGIGLTFGPYFGLLTGRIQYLWNMRNGPFFGFPLMLAGFYLARYRIRPTLWIGATLFVFGCGLEFMEFHLLRSAHWSPRHDEFFGTFPMGIGAFVVAMHLPKHRITMVAAHLGRYSMGIYAAHLMVLRVLDHLLPISSLSMELVDSAITVALTTALCLLLAKWRVTSRLVR